MTTPTTTPTTTRTTARTAQPAGVPQPPSQFLWQGRLYVIRRVLAHWYEREAWWVEGPALSRRPGPPKSLRDLATDREIWRVEASSGRQSGSGVYDLCRLPAGSAEPGRAGDATEDRSWRLLRVSD